MLELRIILQLETTLRSPHPAIEDQDGGPAAHMLAQLHYVAIVVREYKVRELIARFQIRVNFHQYLHH